MSAALMLKEVAETYRNLHTFEVGMLMKTESEGQDEEIFVRREKRVRACYASPQKVRIEQGGRPGSLTVTDGFDISYSLAGLYRTRALKSGEAIPGVFRPEFPHADGATFLFNRISEQIADAETLREESTGSTGSEEVCTVISVAYKSHLCSGLIISSSPLTFWINPRTSLVSRMEIATTYQLPHHETQTIKVNLTFTQANINKPFEAFTFDTGAAEGAVAVAV